MPYVKRDAHGRIVAVSVEPVGDGWHEIDAESAELAAFGEALQHSQTELAASDLGLARVLEDVIDLLVDRSLIRFTDLPEAAQKKLTSRRSARASMRRLNLLDNEQDTI
jgi:hypothetical protein